MRTIISTVGTSLITNWKRQNPGKEPSVVDLAITLKQGEPARVSAETNSLSHLLQQDDRLVFVYSETPEGKLAGEALCRHYVGAGYGAAAVEIPGLTYTESRFKGRGLRTLVSVLTREVLQARKAGREPIINATGGFKAEVAYAVLVAMLFNARVAYIHDAFREVVMMPPMPISWDLGLVFECESLIEWLGSDYRPADEVRNRMLGLPESAGALVDEEDGLCSLSAMGEALVEAYGLAQASAAGTKILLSSKARESLASLAPEARAGFEVLLARLRIRELWMSQCERKRNSDLLGWPRGGRTERFLFFEEQPGEVRVCFLGLHPVYDKLLAKGVFSKDYGDFTEWVAPPGA